MGIDRTSSDVVSCEFAGTPREVLASVLRMRPRRFRLVRANESVIHLSLSGATAAGIEQALTVQMRPSGTGTTLEISYAGSLGSVIRDEMCDDFLDGLRRGIARERAAA